MIDRTPSTLMKRFSSKLSATHIALVYVFEISVQLFSAN